jgi:hypothetical protein
MQIPIIPTEKNEAHIPWNPPTEERSFHPPLKKEQMDESKSLEERRVSPPRALLALFEENIPTGHGHKKLLQYTRSLSRTM